jgi:hypothetical protein
MSEFVTGGLRLQSFHDGFIPVTSEWQQLKQIGNAVPPLLARAVGTALAAIVREVRGERGDAFVARQPRLFPAQRAAVASAP